MSDTITAEAPAAPARDEVRSNAWRAWAASAVTATIVHAVMLAGVLSGRFDAGASVVGVLLDSLFAYALWLIVYLRLRPSGKGVNEVLAKTFVGLSLGVWGFIAMHRALTVKDFSILAINASILEAAGSLGNVDGDAAGVIIVVVAAVLLIASLYFLGKVVVVMSLSQLAWLGGSIFLFRALEVGRYVARHRDTSFSERVGDAEDHLAELCLHVFAKGWIGALFLSFFAASDVDLLKVYLGWSFAYDVVARRVLWTKLGGGVKAKVLARAASRQTERTPRQRRRQRASSAAT